MRNRTLQVLTFGWMMLIGLTGWAQNSKTLPEDPAEFIKAFDQAVKRETAEKENHRFLKEFSEKWETAQFTGEEQGTFIRITNTMLNRNYRAYPDLLRFAELLDALKSPETFSQIPIGNVLAVADSCIRKLDRKPVLNYLRLMKGFSKNGSVFKTSTASWRFTEPAPKLVFRSATLENGKNVAFPEMTFSNTDLIFNSKRDSTIIYGTTGVVNLMNRKFVGKKGRITWEKMGLPAGEVFCTFEDYDINLNYPTVSIDTVTFSYTSLLNKPLKGSFEDRNRGYRDINKANHPYFRSYEGGITIENLIPNVRYEGGFSLKGIKKIGSSYVEWVDIPDPPEPEIIEEEEEELSEDEQVFEDAYDWDSYYDYDDPSVYELDEDDVFEDNPDWGEDEEEEEEGEDEEFMEENPGEEFVEFIDPYAGKMLKRIPAQLIILRDDAPIMRLKGDEFVLDLEKLHSQNTDVTLYLSDGDSITHPSLELLYEVESDRIFLMKNFTKKSARTPFSSPYHNYSLYFNAIKWDRSKDDIEFTAIIDKENMVGAVESRDYFEKMRFKQFKGVLSFNPITAIHLYEYRNPGQEIYAADVCELMNRPGDLQALLYMLPNLAGSGLIKYDKKTQLIEPLEKLRTWSLAAQGKKDYDAVQILGQVEKGSNAVLNVDTKEIEMRGIQFFDLSDSQYVRVVPFENKVFIEGNRDLRFGGVVGAGKLNFYGQTADKFTFEYDNYKVTCDSIDSLRFILVRNPPMNFVFTPLQKALRNTSIEGVTGAIYINKPYNKNGLETHPEYSIFDSYTNSYVYWAKPDIHGGVYSKDKLYFSIDPFVLDSLETFDESKLSFEGEFYSDEVFPKIRQKLTVMDDFTLGLKHVTPDTGLPVFGGKGRFNDEIVLDGSGLRGNGDLDYNNTLAKSDSFQFFFDSVKAVTNEFYMPGGERDGAYFPEVKAGTVNYKWLTKKDEIELSTTTGEPIVMFEGEGTFDGTLVITPGGVIGKGTLTVGEASITSDQIIFQEKSVKALNGEFAVADKNDPTRTVFKTMGVDVDYDVTGHKSNFQSRTTGEANSFFPENEFATSLGKGDYDRTTGIINLESHSAYKGKNFFVSTMKEQDSLKFKAQEAQFNLNNETVEVEGVDSIHVADATIYPDKNHATIQETGFLQKFENTTISANRETRYHRMYEADVEVLSRHNYKGKGKYDYRSVGGNAQFIKLTEVKVESDTTTFAVGTIDEEENFYLTEKIFFKGNTKLHAYDKYMMFEGFVKIESQNPALGENWIPYEDIVNPDSVFVQLPEKMTDEKGNPLSVGLHFIPDRRVFYSTFLMPKTDPKKDLDILTTSGGLTVDTRTGEFKIGPKAKLLGQTYKGATVSYDDASNTITSEGLLDFPEEFEKNTITVDMAGKWRDEVDRKETTSDLVLKIGLDCIPKEAWAKLSERFKAAAITNDNVDFQYPLLINSLAEFLDEKDKDEKATKALVKEVEENLVTSDIKVAKDLPSSVLLGNVNFRFDQKYKALYHNGELDLIGINGEPINKRVQAKIEYNFGKMTPSGARMKDTLRMYIEVEEMNWVYFNFSGDVLDTWSSDNEGYNAALSDALAKRKKEEGFRFHIVGEADKSDFLARFISRYVFRN